MHRSRERVEHSDGVGAGRIVESARRAESEALHLLDLRAQSIAIGDRCGFPVYSAAWGEPWKNRVAEIWVPPTICSIQEHGAAKAGKGISTLQ